MRNARDWQAQIALLRIKSQTQLDNRDADIAKETVAKL
jgi:hypothetical protein